MDLVQAETLARELMAEHGLEGWTLRWSRARRQFGSCRYGRREIALSRTLTRLNSREEVRDVILHEIAHALVGPGHGHDQVWRRTARALGTSGQRCFGEEVASPPPRYIGRCPTPGCPTVLERDVVRGSLRTAVCARCSQRDGWPPDRYRLIWRRNGWRQGEHGPRPEGTDGPRGQLR